MKHTLKEASSKLGISVKALRYRIKARGLELEMEDGVHGKRYVLSEEQIKVLGILPSASDEDAVRGFSSKPRNRTQDAQHTPQEPENAQYRFQDPVRESSWTAGNQTGIPIDVYRDTQEALKEALALSREQREDRLDAERKAEEARDNAMRMAYRVQELTHELTSQRNLLTESAESLNEKQAEVQELEDFKAEEKAKREAIEKERAEIERKLKKVEESALKAAQEAKEREERLLAAEAELKAREERGKLPFWKRWF